MRFSRSSSQGFAGNECFDYACLQTGLKQMFALYYTPHTCSLASHIALEDTGAEYELRRIDFSKNEQQSPEYLRVNPKARVPALVTPHGILTETPAILTFIAQTFPQAALAPLNDPFAFAELQAFTSYYVRLFTSRTPIGCAGIGGRVTLLRSRICSAECLSRSVLVTA